MGISLMLMKSQPQMLNDWKEARLWCRFFTVGFVTMYLNDIQLRVFYAVGLDAREYDIYVIKKTNETAARVFPVMLDVENPVLRAAGCLCKE